jgi:Cof subfamily protein (haloacid dehalogenase superfamily)
MTNTHRIRLVVSDVDGTLVTPDKQLTERTKAAVRKLAEANIAFAITSGRPARGMRMFVEPLGLRTPLGGFNGGIVVHPDAKLAPIEVKAMAPDIVVAVIRGLIRRGFDPWVYQYNDWVLRDPNAAHAAHEQANVRFAPIVTKDLERHIDGVVKIVGVSDDMALMEACENEARERFGGVISAARSRPHFLDITRPDANKGAFVQRLSRELGVPREAIATLGDMPNDVHMFAHSGLSIVMGQASEELKRAATTVTKSNTEEGFAEAIERYVLGDAESTGARHAQF